jgi:hypothetical protein
MMSGGSLRLSGTLAEEARTVTAAGSGIGRVSLWGQFPSSTGRDPPGDARLGARDWDDSDADPPDLEQGCACWWSLSEPPPPRQVESGLK